MPGVVFYSLLSFFMMKRYKKSGLLNFFQFAENTSCYNQLDLIKMATDSATNLSEEIEQSMVYRYGPLIANDDLRIALGYQSMAAFRMALSRKRVGVPVFSLPGQKGKFALSRDVALWLARQREQAIERDQSPAY